MFSRQVEALGRPGDLLVGISTSGNSPNVILAVEAAKELGMRTLGLLGRDGGKLKGLVDDALVVPSHRHRPDPGDPPHDLPLLVRGPRYPFRSDPRPAAPPPGTGRGGRREPLGLYLHVPFCRDRCTYCSFVTTRDESLKAAVLARLRPGLRAWGEALGRPAVDTLYLGGGTPSLLGAGRTGGPHRRRAARPSTWPPWRRPPWRPTPAPWTGPGWKRPGAWAGTGSAWASRPWTTASWSRLGRIHDARAALEALAWARRAGFQRVSADLMVGIPGQRLDRVLGDARTLVEAGATHLSIYLLDLDKACPLRAQVDAGKLALPSEDEVADVFEALQEELPRLGLEPYEISNYAAPGQASRHNSRYWERRPYLGLGPSAASQLGAWRWTESGVIPAWTEGRGTRRGPGAGRRPRPWRRCPCWACACTGGWTGSALRARGAGPEPGAPGGRLGGPAGAVPGARAAGAGGACLRFTARGMLVSNGVLQIFV